MDFDINDFFVLFICLLLAGIGIFWFYHSDFQFECPLPKGGYYKIHWLKDEKRFEVFHWQPGENAKPLPQNAIILRKTKKEEDEK